MLQSGDHAWNSGMFIWRVDRILAEFARQMPDLYAQLERIDQPGTRLSGSKSLPVIWPALERRDDRLWHHGTCAQRGCYPGDRLGLE